MGKRYRALLFAMFLLLGSIVSIQIRTIMSQNKEKSAETLHAEELKDMVDEEKSNIAKLKAAIAENEKIMNQNLKSVVEYDNNITTKNELSMLDDINLKACLTDVQGPGIIIKLDDALARNSMFPDLLVIHDSDIKKIINELKVAGAQAISINDERLLPTSETICAGPTILINKNKYPVPYIIKAIGNSDNLSKKVSESDIILVMRKDGIRINIDKSKEVKILKYSGNLNTLTQGLEVAD